MIKVAALTIFFTVACNFVFAQVPSIQWQKCLGGTAMDVGNYIVQTSDGGYITAGTSASNNIDVTGNHGGYDCWVVKQTSTGAISWQKSFGGTQSDEANFIQQTADGGYIVATSTYSNDGDVTTNHGSFDAWIFKLTTTGSISWQQSFGGSGYDMAHCVRQTSDGGYIIAASSTSNDGDVTGNHGGYDFWVVKLSATGGITWQKSFGGTGDDFAGSVWETLDGSYVVAGNSNSNDGDVSGNHGGDDYWVIKLSSSGALLWQKSLGGSDNDDLVGDAGSAGMQQTADSGIILAGWSKSNDGDITGNHGNFDYWVVKLSPSGSLVWQKSFGGTGDDEATSLQQTADSGFIVAGTSFSNDGDVSGNNGSYDYWVIKLSPTGSLQWQKCMGGTGMAPGDCANGIRQTTDGGYIVTGFSDSNDSDVSGNHGGFDYWAVKLNNPLISLETNNTTSYQSIQIAPNPTPGTIYVLGVSRATIKVYSATGQLITEAYLTDHISLTGLPYGIYFVRVFDYRGIVVKEEFEIKY